MTAADSTAKPQPAAMGMNWPARLQAAGIHLGVSAAIAALAALLVFWLWYPYPYREISSGRELFLIVVTVDVILGPLLTLAIFNLKKPKAELKRDIAVIATIQLAALSYGMWTVFVARPVHLVFEYDRFRVIHAIDLPQEFDAKLQNHRFPLGQPTPLGLRPFKTPAEQADMTLAALGGVHLSVQPDLWVPYEQAKPQVLAASKPMTDLRQRFAAQKTLIDSAIADSGKAEAELRFLPMVGRKTFWTVLLDANTAQPLAYVRLDSF